MRCPVAALVVIDTWRVTVQLRSAPPPKASLPPERSTDHANAVRTGLSLTVSCC